MLINKFVYFCSVVYDKQRDKIKQINNCKKIWEKGEIKNIEYITEINSLNDKINNITKYKNQKGAYSKEYK